MKLALILLLALPCICLASSRPCTGICPPSTKPVCIANEGHPIFFPSQCMLDYYRCLTGKVVPVVSAKLCKDNAIDEGKKLITTFLGHDESSSSQESNEDENSSSTE